MKYQVCYERPSRTVYLDVNGAWTADPDAARVFVDREEAKQVRDKVRESLRHREKFYVTVEETV